MKKIFVLSFMFMIAYTAFAEQSYKIKFYRNNGQEPLTYNIYDIQKIGIRNISDKYIMKIHFQDTNTAYYPVMSIDSVKFETDTNHIKFFTPYIFGSPIHYRITEIDSIIFNDFNTKINDDVVVVDTSQLKKIISIDSSGLILDKSSTLGKDLKTGDIIAGEPSDNAINGFLKKVKSIKTVGDSLIIETEDISITDVIENGIISFRKRFKPSDTLDQKAFRKNDEFEEEDEGEFTMGYEDVELIPGIKFTGKDTFKPDVGFDLVIEDASIKQIVLKFSIENTLELSATANLKYEKKGEVSLNKLLGRGPFRLPSLKFMIGILPVVITSNIELMAGYSLNIGDKVSSGVKHELKVSSGIEYNNGEWKTIGEQSSEFSFDAPKLSLNGKLKGYVGPQLNVSFYGLEDAFKAHANVYGFGELEVDLLAKPLWKIKAGIESTAGISSKWFEFEKETSVFEYSTTIAQSKDLISTVVPDSGKTGNTITITGEGFGEKQDSSFVAFKFGSSLANVDLIKATEYESWSNTEIKFKIPAGLSLGKVMLLLNIDGFFSNMKEFKIAIKNPFITSIIPDEDTVGATIVIKGGNFGDTKGTSMVIFDDYPATEFITWSDTSITLIVPEFYSTETFVYVYVKDSISNAAKFYKPLPRIFSLDPPEDSIGATVRIIGKNFGKEQNSSYATFNNILVTVYLDWSDTLLTVKVPKNTKSGYVRVFVKDIGNNNFVFFKVISGGYDSVKIGSQIWMVKNLNVTKYRNGDIIPEIKDSSEWAKIKTGAWCYYNNDPANGAIYGKLYNWYAVNDPRGLAPEGWHIPSHDEYLTLDSFLMGHSQYWCHNNSLYTAKSVSSKELWSFDGYTCTIGNNLNANNSSGFSALPGGFRSVEAELNSHFEFITHWGFWWSSTSIDSLTPYTMELSSHHPYFYHGGKWSNTGLSVRCIRN